MTSAIAAKIVLVLIALALICALLYALYGNPSSNKGKKRKQEVMNGFRLGVGILLGIVLMGGLLAGAGEAFGTMTGTRLAALPRWGDLVVAFVSLGLIAALAQRWAKYFAGWVGYGILNALMSASSGHFPNHPNAPVARSFALSMAALFFVSAFVSLRFTKNYKLSLLDKTALVVWVLGITVGVIAEKYCLVGFSAGCGALVIAWLYHRATLHRKRRTTQAHYSESSISYLSHNRHLTHYPISGEASHLSCADCQSRAPSDAAIEYARLRYKGMVTPVCLKLLRTVPVP